MREVRTIKPATKPLKVSDGGGLFLLVQPTGSKLWRMAYRFDRKQRTAAFGTYPTISLAEARSKREEVKKILREGKDPAGTGRAQKAAKAAAMTFREVAEDWYATKMIAEGKATTTLRRTRWLLDALNEDIGDRPIAEIEPHEVLQTLKKMQARDVMNSTQRLRTAASAVFRFGIVSGYCKVDPAVHLGIALTSGAGSTSRPAVTDPIGVGELMRAIEQASPERVRHALRLLALTCVRPGELIGAEWSEIDGNAWTSRLTK